MKKPFFKTFVGRALLSAGKKIPVLSTVIEVAEDTEESPKGNMSASKMVGSTIGTGAIIALVGGALLYFNVITWDQFMQLIGIAG